MANHPPQHTKTTADKGSDGSSGVDRSFAAALRAAQSSPASTDAWDHLEELADKLQKPDEVAALYQNMLELDLPNDVFSAVAARSVQFHEEWFGDTPDKITGLMSRIIELDPNADWAFERLSVLLTSAAQWDDLLGLYDRTIATATEAERKQQLLEHAAQTAKDFADSPDRAADYLQQLLVLDPGNAQLVQSLERLLARGKRFNDLIQLWESQLGEQSADEARETRLRAAGCWLDELGNGQRALDVVAEILNDNPGEAAACALLERILMLDSAEPSTRHEALALLRKSYLVADRAEDLVRVLEAALSFVEDDERRSIHRELATRKTILGRDIDAMADHRALLLSDPSDPDARKQLRQLASRCGRRDLHIDALVAAAEACSDGSQKASVLLEAARLRSSTPDDAQGAIELYTQIVDNRDAEHSDALAAAHNLAELLATAGRDEQRLDVLEKLAALERSSAVRRHVLGEAARLAQSLGNTDRALSNWAPVLRDDEHDVEALAAVTQLLDDDERWAELVDALSRRADANVLPLQRRADLVRIAQVQVQHLDETNAAIGTWLKVRNEFGETPETIAALDELMSSASRFDELAHLLGNAAAHERERSAAMLARLGTLHLHQLQDSEQALAWYAEAIAVEPKNQEARKGLHDLLSVAEHSATAADALANAYHVTDDWKLNLELLESRLEATTSRGEKALLLREAAQRHLERGDDPASALSCLCRSLPLEPDNLATQVAAMKLAEKTEGWGDLAESLRLAAEAATEAPLRAAELNILAGDIHEQRLSDHHAALLAYQAARNAKPEDPNALEAATRCAAALGSWPTACEAALGCIALDQRTTASIISTLEAGATQADDWLGLTTAMVETIGSNPAAPQLETAVATWYRDHLTDLDAAEQAAARAADHDETPSLATLELLADLQRRNPGPALVDTLLAIDRTSADSLDALREAAQISTEQDDVALTQRVLERLYRKAGSMWVRDAATTGDTQPSEVTQWALNKLVAHLIFAGNATRAVHTLMDAAHLPLDTEHNCELRRRAAEMLSERGERSLAIDVYRGVLQAHPNDVAALQVMAQMCEAQGRVSEALALRLRELGLIEDVERRLELRLDHSRLTGALEEQGGRVASLKANIADVPGHQASIDELSRVLDERGKHCELADILESQANELEQLGQTDDAAGLWTRAASLAEQSLGDYARAIAGHTRVVELSENNDALDALARLHLEQNAPAPAAEWLERRLGNATSTERVAVLLKLARARIRAEQRDAAVSALRTAFDEAPRNAEVRKLLLNQYRTSKNWQALADTLATAALAVSDAQTSLGYAREAAELYHHTLATPEAAVPVLTKAVEIDGGDRELRSMLAEALSAAGELDAAKALLEQLIADFGRRRSPERAQVHLALARVTALEGHTDEAVNQLDTASKMDASNATILKTLAELATEAGQLDRAERALRTLLVTARRETEPDNLPIGPTEVLFELSRIATRREEHDKANELFESVLEGLPQHDLEAAPIQDKLAARGEHDLLKRVLDHRLSYIHKPHARAAVLATLGELLAGPLERPEDGLAARLEAVKTAPGSPLHHQAAWDVASRLDSLGSYVSVVEALLSDERADTSAHVRCELLLRLGEVLEKERNDLDRAGALYGQAEATGVRTVDVWRAQARVAEAQGAHDEQMRLLQQLANLGEDQAETRADALYRMAEVSFASSETLDEGLTSLGKALADDFKGERAALILQRACNQHPDHVGLLDLYEQVARRSENDHTLIHYLERRSGHVQATHEQVREAVELAIKLDETDTAEALMLRATDIGRAGSRADDLRDVSWALIGLAERRLASNDLAGAVKWLGEAAEVADLEPVFALARQVAEMAEQPDGDLTLAAKLYERLVERAADARQAWEPLASIYLRLDDVNSLTRMVDETLDGLQDPGDRNALRVMLARALLNSEDRTEEAITVLRQVLVEEPDQQQAQRLMFEHLERTGQLDELASLLQHQLDTAIGREDATAIKKASLALVAGTCSDDDAAALDILRQAIRWNADDEDLLAAVLSRLGDDHLIERCQLMAALIRVEAPDTAGPRALALMSLHESIDDADGALDALRLGAERAPDDADIRDLLQERYRERGDFAGLADCLLAAAQRTEDDDRKAALLRETANLRREHLGDAAGASDLLRRACALQPEDAALCIELARSLSSAGMHDQSLQTVGQMLEDTEAPAVRLQLLRARADLHRVTANEAEAIADLEQAFAIDAASVTEELEAALVRALEGAAATGDADAERRHTLRHIEVLLAQQKREEASHKLTAWAEHHPDDVESLRRLREMDTADGRWQAVADTCQRLIHLEEGAAQIDATVGLSHAYLELDSPGAAREGLEHVLTQQPDNPQVRSELRKIYEQLEDQTPLAKLLTDDADALEADEDKAELLRRVGHIYVDAGDMVSAIPPLRKANELMPGQPAAIVPLADAYILAGWFDDANELLDSAIAAGKGRRTPEICVYYHRKAQLADAQGDASNRLALLLDAHQCNKKNGLVAADLANLAEELEQWDLAAKTLRTITLIDTECPISRSQAFLRQGRIAKMQGDDKSAKMWARRARREDPDNEEAAALLEELGERHSLTPGRGR